MEGHRAALAGATVGNNIPSRIAGNEQVHIITVSDMRKQAYNTMTFESIAIALAELVGQVYNSDPDGYRRRANLRIRAELEAAIDAELDSIASTELAFEAIGEQR